MRLPVKHPFPTFVRTKYTVCELVKSPTLCGSPTVMSKEGFAACSMLMLGVVSRRTSAACEGCIGGGILGPSEDGPSSFESAESVMLLPIGLCNDPAGCLVL